MDHSLEENLLSDCQTHPNPPYQISLKPEHISDRDLVVVKGTDNSNQMEPEYSHHTLERDNTPHRVFKSLPYPKTGGWLGSSYLIWGSDRFNYFPLVFLLGPQWYMSFVTLLAIIVINATPLVFAFAFKQYYAVYIIIGIFLLTFISFTLTSFSNPGIAPIGKLIDYQNQLYSYCRKCKIVRPMGCLHCDDCQACVYQVDHHCFWMGKCIGKNNFFFFYSTIVLIGASFVLYIFGIFLLRFGISFQ
ncbi:hypothetical protein WA158_007235 [Blastocystis sp. Blastoise]